jgi:hypothetical protein
LRKVWFAADAENRYKIIGFGTAYRTVAFHGGAALSGETDIPVAARKAGGLFFRDDQYSKNSDREIRGAV